MDLRLDAEESAVMLAALRSYSSDLRMEIVGADNPAYKRDLRHEREVLERALAKLDDAEARVADDGEGGARTSVRFVAVWST